MKTPRFPHFVISLSIVLMLLCFTGQGLAADYNTTATFSADNVSTVAPGDSQRIDIIDDEFWGVEWGSYDDPIRKTYGNNDIVADEWGDFGYYAAFTTSGRIGLTAEAAFDYGTMDINAPLDINMQTSKENYTTTVSTDYSILSGAGFETSGTEGNFGVSFLTDYVFNYYVGAAAGFGTSSSKAEYEKFSQTPIIDIDQNSAPVNETLLGGLVNVTAQIPNVVASDTFNTASGLSGDVNSSLLTASDSSSDSILGVGFDVDKAFNYATGLPTEVSFDLYNDTLEVGLDVSGSLIQAEVGAVASLSQDFTVTMNPEVHLDFDRPVWARVGADGEFLVTTHIETDLGTDLEIITPRMVRTATTYSLEWAVSNNSNIDIDAWLDLAIGNLSVDIGYGFSSWGTDISLWEDRFETELASVSVYDETWRISGQDIAGENFLLNFDSELFSMLDKAIDETNQTFIVAPSSIDARDDLSTIIKEKEENTATTPDPNAPKDLFTENGDLYGFLANNYNSDGDSERVDYLDGFARYSLLEILKDYDPANANYFDFLLDVTGIYNLGIDFQPLFDDAGLLVTGLVASFYNLDFLLEDAGGGTTSGGPISSFNPYIALSDVPFLADLGLDNLLGTSFAFFYNDLVGMTDLTVYQNSLQNRASFDYAYSSLEQFIEPVPEPATILLFGSGLIGLFWYGRKRKKV